MKQRDYDGWVYWKKDDKNGAASLGGGANGKLMDMIKVDMQKCKGQGEIGKRTWKWNCWFCRSTGRLPHVTRKWLIDLIYIPRSRLLTLNNLSKNIHIEDIIAKLVYMQGNKNLKIRRCLKSSLSCQTFSMDRPRLSANRIPGNVAD